MTKLEIGLLCIAVGLFYAGGLVAFPSLFRNPVMCPRWGLFGPPASLLSGVGGGVAGIALGLVNINIAKPFAPIWVPWGALAISFAVVVAGVGRKPFFTGTRPN